MILLRSHKSFLILDSVLNIDMELAPRQHHVHQRFVMKSIEAQLQRSQKFNFYYRCIKCQIDSLWTFGIIAPAIDCRKQHKIITLNFILLRNRSIKFMFQQEFQTNSKYTLHMNLYSGANIKYWPSMVFVLFPSPMMSFLDMCNHFDWCYHFKYLNSSINWLTHQVAFMLRNT